ncbi:phage tail family protein [Leuconostoc carnosum]|uniref:phage tail domain-containing protein n=1 Tax=Leuconostoc carnosum TaxID=1252 RepID=UPI00123A2B9F|nr:phage tail domain-containing protein [Leuconostoc carnosum]KAA8371889.1 phage tail family protein [Leuconostoc carnosum]KAA8377115.1 phage tail family protein [Leuconostoc carnosum]
MTTNYQGDIIIQRRDGKTYDLEKEGIRVITFDPPSPNFQHTYTQTGDYGADLTGTQVHQTTIPLIFDVVARDNYDYELQRLKVLQIFSSNEPFYVINMRTPFLRWKVVAEAFSYPRLGNFWKAKSVAVNLVCYEGFSESTATTKDPFTFDGGSYGIGMGIPFDTPKYSFVNQPKFRFLNPSLIPLLANERPVTLSFRGNAPSGVTIKNNTTGQYFVYKKPLTKSNYFKLVGLIPIVDGLQRFGNSYSDRSFIDYAIGYNDMEIVGSTDFTLDFNTRFYY